MRRWREFYTVVYKGRKTVHAVFTKWSPMGEFHLDQMFGGGMQSPCGKKCEGDAVISPTTTNRKKKVTCKRCRKFLEQLSIFI